MVQQRTCWCAARRTRDGPAANRMLLCSGYAQRRRNDRAARPTNQASRRRGSYRRRLRASLGSSDESPLSPTRHHCPLHAPFPRTQCSIMYLYELIATQYSKKHPLDGGSRGLERPKSAPATASPSLAIAAIQP